jgi:hypothetical protein
MLDDHVVRVNQDKFPPTIPLQGLDKEDRDI